jgi:aminopeptidase YwaD
LHKVNIFQNFIVRTSQNQYRYCDEARRSNLIPGNRLLLASFLAIAMTWQAVCLNRKFVLKQVVLLFFILNFTTANAQDSLYTRKVINTLCSKQFAGRGYVKNGLDIAAKYISAELKKFKAEPLYSTGYFQWFDFNVNTFPAKMNVKVNGKTLKPGVDFIVSEESAGLKGSYAVEKKDSVTYLAKNSELPCMILLKKKLTFSVSTKTANYCSVELLNNNTYKYIKTVELNIENKLLTKYICKNICAYIKGTAVNNDTVVVLTAHYDHLGMMGSKTWFPGANDNASGVSMLLNLVKYYSTHVPKYKTVFLFFAGEEAGLLGSQYFTEHPAFELSKVKFLINLDLLGTGDEGITVVNATEFKPQFEVLKKINAEKNYLVLVKPRGKAHNSDHYWFTEKGVPSFFIYTMGGIKAYHDVFDRPQTLPLTRYKAVFNLLVDFISII